VQWEAALIREEFYADRVAAMARFVPVVLPGQSSHGIPVWLGPATTTHYVVSAYTVVGAKRLIRYLSGQPFETEPSLGSVPVLPARGIAAVPGVSRQFEVGQPSGPRTVVVLRVRLVDSELVTETVVAGTVLGTRAVVFRAALLDGWAALDDPPAAALAALAEAGRALTAALFEADTERVIAQLVDSLPPGGGVDVVFDGVGPAIELPIELMRLRTAAGVDLGPLCLLGGVTIMRRLPGSAAGSPPSRGPLKILAAIAAPDETKATSAPLDVEAEMQAVLDAVSGLPGGGGQVRILEVASLPQIQAALEAEEFHVLHLSAHGTATVVELEDEDGAPDRLPPKMPYLRR